MATLFDPVPTIAPQANPSPGQTIDVPEGAFGAATARATQGFGQSVTKAAETGMDVITARAHLDNEVHASEVNTWLADQITDKYGQFTKLEGKAALDALPQFKQDIGDLQEQAVNRSGSLQERAMLAKSGTALTTRYYSYGERHASTQWRGWADKTAVDQAQSFGNVAGIAAANGDDAGMAQALHASDDAVAKLFEQRGWPQDAIQTEVAKNRGRNLKQIIEAQANEDPLAAVNRFKEVANQMDPASRLATQNHLRPIITKLHGREIADEELGRAPAPEGNRSAIIIQKFQEAGYTPEQAAAVAGHFYHESANNPNAVHDNGIGLGIAGWNKERLDNLKKFAADQGTKPTDFNTQVDFAIHELDTTESKAGAALKNAKSIEDATTAFMHYERPRGYTPENPRGGDSYGARLSNAAKFANGNFTSLPDKSVAFERIVERTGNNPALQDAALAHANKIYTIYNSERAGAKAQFQSRVQDTTAESMRTGTVQQPLTGQDFVEHLGPDQGIRAYESYRQNLQLGTDIASVATMSPAEQVALVKKYEPQPGEGFADQTKRQDALRTAIDHVQKESQKDAGAFALDRLPAVKDAYTKFVEAQGGNDPAAAQAASRNFVNVTLAEQERVGIPPEKRNVLPAAVANAILTGITKKSANAVAREGQSSFDLAANIKGQAELWGENWPLVYKQIEKDAGPLLRVVGSGVLPQAAAKLSELNGMTTQQILKNEDTDKPAEVKKQVVEAFKPFAATLVGAQDRLTLLDSFRGQGEKLAADYVVNGMGATDAAAKAFNDLLGHKYNFVSQSQMSMRDFAGNTFYVPSSYRIPKDVPFLQRDIEYGATALKASLGTRPSGAPTGSFAGLSERGNIDLDARPSVKNAEGSISTVRSMDVAIENGVAVLGRPDANNRVLLPTVSDDGRVMTDQEAVDSFNRTGRHLGKFNTPEAANRYAAALHEAQDRRYASPELASPRDTMGGLGADYLGNVKPKAYARDAVWITAPGDAGLMLVYNDEAVRTKDGQPYIKTWKELAIAGQAAVKSWTGQDVVSGPVAEGWGR